MLLVDAGHLAAQRGEPILAGAEFRLAGVDLSLGRRFLLLMLSEIGRQSG